MTADSPHVYDGRYYRPPVAVTIACTKPTRGAIAAWAGVANIAGQWAQAGVYSTADETHAYLEQNPPYTLTVLMDTRATVTFTRLPSRWRISLNGRTVRVPLIGRRVWVGVERIDGADGDCTIDRVGALGRE